MARKREGTIQESLDELRSLNKQHGPQPRIRMLRMLKEDPSLTLVQVAERIGIAEKTVRRWLKIYEEGGLEKLLSEKKPAEVVAPSPPATRDSSIPGHICDFLNGLPQSEDTVEWVEAFRTGFRQLYSDLDRVSINVNINALAKDRAESDSTTYVTQHLGTGKMEAGSEIPFFLTTTINRGAGSPGGRLVADAKRQGFPVDRYHPPHVFDYYTTTRIYVGSMILWREIGRRQISPRTLRSIEKLRSFLTFMLTDCIARRRQADPGISVFTDTIERIVEKEKLTPRQRDILIHQLLGKTYLQTAEALGIAVNTVRSHVKGIHARTGTSTLVELFARHFSPLQTSDSGHSGHPKKRS